MCNRANEQASPMLRLYGLQTVQWNKKKRQKRPDHPPQVHLIFVDQLAIRAVKYSTNNSDKLIIMHLG